MLAAYTVGESGKMERSRLVPSWFWAKTINEMQSMKASANPGQILKPRRLQLRTRQWLVVCSFAPLAAETNRYFLSQPSLWQDLAVFRPAPIPHLSLDTIAQFGLDLEQNSAKASYVVCWLPLAGYRGWVGRAAASAVVSHG